MAQSANITGSPTNITSAADRMISYRHQEKMWAGADGALHLVVNRGALSPDASLVLYTSLDNGRSWNAGLTLPQTDGFSTSDGLLVGDMLNIAYKTSDGSIVFAQLHYDPLQRSWSPRSHSTVIDSTDKKFLNPAIAIDETGVIWCAYVAVDRLTNNTSIGMSYLAPSASNWASTGQVFGAVDNLSIERSARPIAMPGGVGMVYTVHEKFLWASRAGGAAPDAPWASTRLYDKQPPYDLDPYASHFSIVADALNNLHLVTVDHGHLLYMRYRARTGTWDPARVMTDNLRASYVQATMTDEGRTLMVITDVLSRNLRVFQSTNFGVSFTMTDQLVHGVPKPGSGIDYQYPRMESPSYSPGPVPVLQQFKEGKLEKLLSFTVPSLAAPR